MAGNGSNVLTTIIPQQINEAHIAAGEFGVLCAAAMAPRHTLFDCKIRRPLVLPGLFWMGWGGAVFNLIVDISFSRLKHVYGT